MTNNSKETDMNYILLKQIQDQIQDQLRELNANSKETAKEIQQIRIEITKLNHLNTDIELIKKETEDLKTWKKSMESIVTLDDIRRMKEEINLFKKFQIQTLTISFIIIAAFQIIVPYILKSFFKI